VLLNGLLSAKKEKGSAFFSIAVISVLEHNVPVLRKKRLDGKYEWSSMSKLLRENELVT
jgi:hypothetical protein